MATGYKLPHPLEHKIVVKVETTSDSNPKKAMQLALSRLKEEFTSIEEKFKQDAAPPSVEAFALLTLCFLL